MDYTAFSEVLIFDTCEKRRCVNISIVNDEALEGDEYFFVNLGRTHQLDSRIKLNPFNGLVQISDHDGVCRVSHK